MAPRAPSIVGLLVLLLVVLAFGADPQEETCAAGTSCSVDIDGDTTSALQVESQKDITEKVATFKKETEADADLQLACTGSSALDAAVAVDDVLKQVKGGHNATDDLRKSWRLYQESLFSEAFVSSGASGKGASRLSMEGSKDRQRRLRVLLVSPVSNGMLKNAAANARKLKENAAGDEFRFAFFQYQQKGDSPPLPEGLSASDVVLNRAGPGCKLELWKQLTNESGEGVDPMRYDYVWLLDGDLLMDYFSWDLYRHFLVKLDPLVSQPSIVGARPKLRASDIKPLRMQGPEGGRFLVAGETYRTEVQAPVISTRLWPAIYDRMQHMDPRTVWGIDRFWDELAIAAKEKCNAVGLLKVNASPLRHENCHDLSQGTACLRTFSRGSCNEVTEKQGKLVATSLAGICPKDESIWSGLKPGCLGGDRKHLQEWAVATSH